MDNTRLLVCLGEDYARLRGLATLDLNAEVPSCPGWTVADLVRHVAEVYLHKATTMRAGRWPSPWPPPELAAEPPIALLERAFAALTDEFADRSPGDAALTWHGPDQTVGFWIRRMAQETVIHRIDAELALGEQSAPISDDLAIDGIDEVLKLFLGYGSRAWADELGPVLGNARSHTIAVRVDSAGWLVRTGPGGVDVADVGAGGDAAVHGGAGAGGDAGAGADAIVAGPPVAVLRWLWAREADGPTAVEIRGEDAAVDQLRRLLVAVTQ